MKALVTGAGGQLGTDLCYAFAKTSYEVIAANHAALDVGDRDAVLGAITALEPDVVVHAGAWTAVDACESDPDRAYRTNSLGARYVAEACAAVDAHLTYVSTDYVFDGELDRPYHEWDAPNPRSVYGKSKLGGEREAAALGTRAAIARTSWVMGTHGSNMLKTVLRVANQEERPTMRFVDDQVGCPTFTADLAAKLVEISIGRRSGITHVTNQGSTSWYGFVREVLTAIGQEPAGVEPIKTSELDPPRPAPRPANSVLDNSVLRLGGLGLLPDWRHSLREALQALGHSRL